ncbi:Putative cyclin-A3-1 [Zea mays]|uniref:Putative cyclin-A3-1 n=1 Tax=Zea mays TaxID=4577 RepID=A0A1D6HAY3_MAIZE|nr:Putative cyclin-A3-1 [Zea mays]
MATHVEVAVFPHVPNNPMYASNTSPRTPAGAVVLAAPLSYDDDANGRRRRGRTNTKQQPPQYDYDADIDATLRTMEKETIERPSPDYLSDRQAGEMLMMDRADLVEKMHRFCTSYDLAPGALHRAVSFVDRAAAVFAVAKYEDRNTMQKINVDGVAMYAGCTRSEAVDQERELLATIGFRLSGPTAYTFVDHFMRHNQEEGTATVRSLAHHLANMALQDYRCVAFLPSAVAASAILLARMVLNCWTETPVAAAGYTLEELSGCIEAICDMHEHQRVWPGCAQMMRHWEISAQFSYLLPPLT